MTSPVNPAPTRTELVLASATGVWLVASASETKYFLDADHALLLRVPGEGSSRGPGDGVWRRLNGVDCVPDGGHGGGHGVVRVGFRHRYQLGASWWIQRRVTAIEQVAPEHVPQEAGVGQSDAQFAYQVATAAVARAPRLNDAQQKGVPVLLASTLPRSPVNPAQELTYQVMTSFPSR